MHSLPMLSTKEMLPNLSAQSMRKLQLEDEQFGPAIAFLEGEIVKLPRLERVHLRDFLSFIDSVLHPLLYQL